MRTPGDERPGPFITSVSTSDSERRSLPRELVSAVSGNAAPGVREPSAWIGDSVRAGFTPDRAEPRCSCPGRPPLAGLCLTSWPWRRHSLPMRSSINRRRLSATTSSAATRLWSRHSSETARHGLATSCSELGARAGSFDAQELGRRANEYPPQLLTHDRYGHRIDVIRYHPAYHELMTDCGWVTDCTRRRGPRIELGHTLHAQRK